MLHKLVGNKEYVNIQIFNFLKMENESIMIVKIIQIRIVVSLEKNENSDKEGTHGGLLGYFDVLFLHLSYFSMRMFFLKLLTEM